MARRCEVVLKLPEGRLYSIILEADSAFDAALKFFHYCNNPPAGMKRPHLTPEDKLEVRPIYNVCLEDAIEWAQTEPDKRRYLLKKE